MRQFFRILKYSSRYWRRLVASVFCTHGGLLSWSLNLSAIYPVLKILSTDKNLQQWVDEELDHQQRQLDDPERLSKLEEQRAALKRMEQNPPPDHETLVRKATQQIAKLEGELNYHATWVYRYQF